MGNASSRGYEPDSPLGTPPGSPLVTPRSPLTFGPQAAMAPLPQPTDFSLGGGRSAALEIPTLSWPVQPTLVPTPIVCACPPCTRRTGGARQCARCLRALVLKGFSLAPPCNQHASGTPRTRLRWPRALALPARSRAPRSPRAWRGLLLTELTHRRCAGSHGGTHVEVEGSFDNWTTRTLMHRNGKDFTVIKLMQPGVYQYKFIVDGEWKYAPEQPAMYDERGNVNNVVEVCEYTPENLENLHSFAPPGSPVTSYDNAGAVAEDFAKEPPTAPPQLHLTLLNVPPMTDAPNILPRPQHVVLNHLYCEKQKSKGSLIMGVTHRYRSKYITVVLYKPGSSSRGGGGHAAAAADMMA